MTGSLLLSLHLPSMERTITPFKTLIIQLYWAVGMWFLGLETANDERPIRLVGLKIKTMQTYLGSLSDLLQKKSNLIIFIFVKKKRVYNKKIVFQL